LYLFAPEPFLPKMNCGFAIIGSGSRFCSESGSLTLILYDKNRNFYGSIIVVFKTHVMTSQATEEASRTSDKITATIDP
jgi:hypothetical protein